ncbi:MAG: helix-turn-helix domain-containing protein [Muribaculum sp.]|nr:helix-turn-helix domain-containing protein [Muribaculum sp.]
MTHQSTTPQIVLPDANGSETNSLLHSINEKLSVLIELERARHPPKTDDAPIAVIPDETPPDVIDTSWVEPNRWYDNGEFCQIFNVAKPTSQLWRSKKLFSYILLGGRVRVTGSEIIRFINVYAAPRRMTVRPLILNNPTS